MHYHIFWGLKTAEEPFVLHFSNKTEALDKFISLIKDVTGETDLPQKEKEFDIYTHMTQVNSGLYKFMLIHCSNECDLDKPAFPINVN